ncbi:type II toxin-antitoxin system toxin DNA ADP-ribosyl transferase DarT [Paenibacillus chitinolyticus]|uniref:type II toxin-antitoxin system toxin DNA ADP-ribosyl transferase DarT n=1 Tax=Paenibacillus chitinolyticus TaxID=79263 RepID=UPI001C4451F3|nr:DUF4433 domain-containing protein [Paenibacillus chitinolyticus]MBV6712505.1 DUF4433 domain-containing protein [Paenibacillus chitinolyticus]
MVPNPTFIYHITNIENLHSIFNNSGLVCINQLHEDGSSFVNIAYEQIQSRRSEKQVPLPPYGNLHDYVPFYFAPRSPMLYTINQGNVAQYQGGQKQIIYLVSTVQQVLSEKIPFVFTDGHAIMSYSEFFNDPVDLKQIDWGIMSSRYWNDTIEYPDRKRKRQAEFLAFEFFPIDSVLEIGVINDTFQDQALKILQSNSINIPVNVRREWYY